MIKDFLVLSLFLLTLFLFALITHFTLSYSLSEINSPLALFLNKENSSAFIVKTETEFKKITKESVLLDKSFLKGNDSGKENNSGAYKERISKDLSRILNENKILLQTDPINSKLYIIAAKINLFNKSPEQARKLMSQASMLSLHEVASHQFMFQSNLAENKLSESVFYADRLFSATPELIDKNTPQLSYLMHNDLSRPMLIKTLTENPVWRPLFFSRVVPQSIKYSVGLTRLFYDELNKTTIPATVEELGHYINSLIVSGNYNLAYKTWLDFLPASNAKTVDNINNGNFEQNPSGLPFDWLISSATNVRAQRASLPEKQSKFALKIEITRSRITFPSIYQLLHLSAGRYSIKGRYKGELIGKRGLFWVVSCLHGKKINESDEIIGRFTQWRTFEFNLDIPDTSCDAQQIVLKHGSRSPSEQMLYGLIWFDDLSATAIKL